MDSQEILDAITAMRRDIGDLALVVGIMRTDVGYIKTQTTKTNGRVDALEENQEKRDLAEAMRVGIATGKAEICQRAWTTAKPAIWALLAALGALLLANGPAVLRALTQQQMVGK